MSLEHDSRDLERQRKQTDKINRKLRLLDRMTRPTPRGKVIHHPRHHDKPLRCQSGDHQWETRMWRWSPWYRKRIPILYCPKCGEFVFKGVHQGTETQREIRERFVPPREEAEPLSGEALVEEIARRINYDPHK